jgi:hypothetical protein
MGLRSKFVKFDYRRKIASTKHKDRHSHKVLSWVFASHCVCEIRFFLLFIYLFIAFLQSTQGIKRVISKRDGCIYLKQVPYIDGSLELI